MLNTASFSEFHFIKIASVKNSNGEWVYFTFNLQPIRQPGTKFFTQ